MRKYYTSSLQDPASDDYDPIPQTDRPIFSEVEEIASLREENYHLKRKLAELQHDTKREEKEVATNGITGVEVTVEEIKEADSQALTFVTVPVTEKAPSGGFISKPKSKSKAGGTKQDAKSRPRKKS